MYQSYVKKKLKSKKSKLLSAKRFSTILPSSTHKQMIHITRTPSTKNYVGLYLSYD